MALSQFLPGPSLSQVGFALGLLRGGPVGALAAFTAFTLPSAILVVLFAFGVAWLDGPLARGALNGLLVAKAQPWAVVLLGAAAGILFALLAG